MNNKDSIEMSPDRGEDKFDILVEELSDLKKSYDILLDKYDHLTKENSQLSQTVLSFQNSFWWRITKPLRSVSTNLKRVLKRNNFTHSILRFLSSLKNLGFGFTFKQYRDRVLGRTPKTGDLLPPPKKKIEYQKNVNFDYMPKFSVLVPLYNTPQNFLHEMIDSVVGQTYSGWELCLADGSDNEHSDVQKTCLEYAKSDPRIVYKKLEKNFGISENTNACIDMSNGDYISLFDHDDILHPSVLFEVAKVINEQGADMIYTDELTFQNKLYNTLTIHYKPDFSPDNLRANNYICHFTTFKKSLLEKSGTFNKEFDGSQDHDMILRLSENAEKIVHIPKILYYWRSHPNSVAADINSKFYAIESAQKAVKSHLQRLNIPGEVMSSRAFPTIFRIKYELKESPLVSIIIPNKDSSDILKTCVDSILSKSTYTNYEIIIVENNSVKSETFDYYNKLAENDKISIVKFTDSFNYSAINNFAVTHAKGKQLLFLNNDMEIIEPSWIEELLMYSQRPDVGAVGAKLYFKNNTVQHGGIIVGIGSDGVAGHSHYRVPKDNFGYMGKMFYARNISAVTAACMMVKKDIFNEVEGFDEAFTVSYNDVDLCLKIREKGYVNIFNPYCELYHYESLSRGYDVTENKKKRFQLEVKMFKEKWADFLKKGDPYFNVNISKYDGNF